MANPSPQLESDRNPQTRCSNCQTVFEVTRELLSSSDTRVRCGECLSIFDALSELRSAADIDRDEMIATGAGGSKPQPASTLVDSEAAVLAGLSNDTAALDVTYSDFDLFSEDADLPEIAYFDQTRDAPEFDFDAVELGSDETFSDTLFVHDVTIDADSTRLKPKVDVDDIAQEQKTADYADIDFISDDKPREPLIFNYRDRDEPKPAEQETAVSTNSRTADAAQVEGKDSAYFSGDGRSDAIELAPETTSGKDWGLRIGMIVLFSALLVGLYLYRERPRLYNVPVMRQAMQLVCAVAGCSVPTPVDIAAVSMVKRNVYAHPNAPNSLKVDVSFRNDASFDQRYPVIVMRLSNRLGRTVAIREFNPDVYHPDWMKGDTLAVREQLDVNLELRDPGQSAHSFEFSFKELK